MKILFIMLGFLNPLFSCNAKKDEIREFIPGTYVQFTTNERGRQYDKLQISMKNVAGNNYHIIRTSSFQRYHDGQAYPWQQHKEEWIGIYVAAKRILYDASRGRVIAFWPEKRLILINACKYKKVK